MASRTWNQFVTAKRNRTDPPIPDLSYAGYHSCSKPIPDVTHPVFNVTGPGADAGRERSRRRLGARADRPRHCRDDGAAVQLHPLASEAALAYLTLRCSPSLPSLRGAGFQPASGQDGRAPRTCAANDIPRRSPAPPRRACLRQGARSAGFQPASGQDGRAPRKRAGERPEAGAAGPGPGGSRHSRHHTSQAGSPPPGPLGAGPCPARRARTGTATPYGAPTVPPRSLPTVPTQTACI